MPSKDFSDFVNRQQRNQDELASNQINWAEQKLWWLNSLDSLYQRVAEYLSEYMNAGKIETNFVPIELEEENIGSYTATEMVLNIGRTVVRLEPIGTLLIGTRGRVDMRGPKGTVRFILVDKGVSKFQVTVTAVMPGQPLPSPSPPKKEIEWTWKILSRDPVNKFSRPNPVQFIDLNKDSFLQSILEIADV